MNRKKDIQKNSMLDGDWLLISENIREHIGEAAFQSWIKPISLKDFDNGVLKMSLPTRFMRDWVLAHYLDQLTLEWKALNPEIKSIEIITQSEMVDDQLVAEESKEVVEAQKSVEGSPEIFGNISASLDKRFKFDRFVVGRPNEFAYAAARRVAEASKGPSFNPLFLY